MSRLSVIVGLALLVAAQAAVGAKRYYEVVVMDPYIELHTGPGRGYPITQVLERGEQIEVLKRRTDWFKVRNDRGIKGWASARQLSRTLETSGKPAKIQDPDRDDFALRKRELGVQLGELEGANVIRGYASWLFTPNLSAELSGSIITGRFSDGWMLSADVVHQPFPNWWISPFFSLGTGVLQINPKSTLVSAKDRTDQTASAGAGLRMHVGRRVLLRAEYKNHVLFTSRDDNEELEEWKAGISFFF